MWCEVAVYPNCNAVLLKMWHHYFKAHGVPCSDIFQHSPPPRNFEHTTHFCNILPSEDEAAAEITHICCSLGVFGIDW